MYIRPFVLCCMTRKLLWHGSRLTNWVGVLSQGLRIAPPEAPVTGYMVSAGMHSTTRRQLTLIGCIVIADCFKVLHCVLPACYTMYALDSVLFCLCSLVKESISRTCALRVQTTALPPKPKMKESSCFVM